jgi:ABC-type glycerol-3-phosphate transport system substrate-binding protein
LLETLPITIPITIPSSKNKSFSGRRLYFETCVFSNNGRIGNNDWEEREEQLYEKEVVKCSTFYTEETGVAVKVVTAASGTYEETLKSEVAKTDAPTLFQINGPIGYNTWQDYCLDLSDTKLYSWLLDKSLAVTGKDGGVFGIPYVVEGYGIIYNNAIMKNILQWKVHL